MGDGGLDQVPGAIQFVPVAQVGPALLRLDDGEVDVEVAVRLLGGGDQVDHLRPHGAPGAGSG